MFKVCTGLPLPLYCDARIIAAKFFHDLEELTEQLFKLYDEDLGVESHFYLKHVDSSELMVKWNHYPACPNPSSILGAKTLTNFNLITFLLQDQVGGLQVERDGSWFDIQPIEGSLVINLGDGFHIRLLIVVPIDCWKLDLPMRFEDAQDPSQDPLGRWFLGCSSAVHVCEASRVVGELLLVASVF
ncbi:hypothetical protein R1sor_021591 [Riccia sorocarpa]|uniref:Isopenicillin N synthase-like Fe(2+) 2OG dioxygenase domain-containing protein n=1 Tax=Riccia sorocarpa TaxID=122646 RepID=A0ABD3GKM0_9MARC